MARAIKFLFLLGLVCVVFLVYERHASDIGTIFEVIDDPGSVTPPAPARERGPETSPLDGVTVRWKEEVVRQDRHSQYAGESPPSPPTDPHDEPSGEELLSEEATQTDPQAATATGGPGVEDDAAQGRDYEIVEHTVEERQNLWKIAQIHLGRGNRWRELRDYNDIGDDNNVRAGTTLIVRVPRKQTSQTKVDPPPPPAESDPVALPRQPARRPEQHAATPPAVEPNRGQPSPRTKEHLIKDGDTLAKLARRYFGNVDDWPAIYEANPKVLKNPHDLRIGLTLRIPLNR